ncbi:hypothetical protein ACP4OV_030437 [Aristida adscensionis]
MKLGVLIFVGLIFTNLCSCMPRDMPKVYGSSHSASVPHKEIRNLMSGTDGKNGPPSNDHQCPLGTYPNCQGMSQSSQEAEQHLGGN